MDKIINTSFIKKFNFSVTKTERIFPKKLFAKKI